MDDSDGFVLEIRNFSDNITSTWKALRNQIKFSDVTLACEDKHLSGHKIVLSASSPVFENLLAQNSHQHPIIYLRGIKYSELLHIMDYIYSGEVLIAQDQLSGFLSVAQDLEIKGLSQSDQIKKILSNENVDPKSPVKDITNNKESNPIAVNLPVLKGTNLIIMEDEPSFQTDVIESEEIIFHCGECEFYTTSRLVHNKHMKSLHGGTTYPCEQCDYIAKHKWAFKRHILTMHEGVQYPCEHCDFKATNKWSLKGHIQNVHEGLCYPCSYCDHKATQKGSLNRHILAIHKGVTYSCDKCDYKGRDTFSLKRHKNKVHKGIQYSCEQCDFITSTRRVLNYHIVSFHGNVPYFCDECSYKAKGKHDLKIHLLSTHKDIRYSCEQCKYKAIMKIDLKDHMLNKHEC